MKAQPRCKRLATYRTNTYEQEEKARDFWVGLHQIPGYRYLVCMTFCKQTGYPEQVSFYVPNSKLGKRLP